MQLLLSNRREVPIPRELFGLFFEDINYAADGGLYAEMIENRSFEFFDCGGDRGDYYAVPDYGYAWSPLPGRQAGKMEYVTGSPVAPKIRTICALRPPAAGRDFSTGLTGGFFWKKESNTGYLFTPGWLPFREICPYPSKRKAGFSHRPR